MNAILNPAPVAERPTDPQFQMQGIPSHLVAHFWPVCSAFIKRALDHASGEFCSDDILRLCTDRSCQLWLISRDKRIFGAITTEIVVYPHRKHCRVITLAGTNFSEWLELGDATLCAWAKEQGCDAVESLVRKGVVPKMLAHGYVQKHIVLVKEI